MQAVKCQGFGDLVFGVVLVALGCFLQVHFYWSCRERWGGCAAIGKAITLVPVVGGIFYVLIRVLVLG